MADNFNESSSSDSSSAGPSRRRSRSPIARRPLAERLAEVPAIVDGMVSALLLRSSRARGAAIRTSSPVEAARQCLDRVASPPSSPIRGQVSAWLDASWGSAISLDSSFDSRDTSVRNESARLALLDISVVTLSSDVSHDNWSLQVGSDISFVPESEEEEEAPPPVFPRRRVALEPAGADASDAFRRIPSAPLHYVFESQRLSGEMLIPERPLGRIGLPRVVLPTPPMRRLLPAGEFHCPLCLEETTARATTTFPCPAEHEFHFICLLELYYRRQFTCPLCRHQTQPPV